MTFANHILSFIKKLSFPFTLPGEIKVMNPFLNKDTLDVCESFYKKYYSAKLDGEWINCSLEIEDIKKIVSQA